MAIRLRFAVAISSHYLNIIEAGSLNNVLSSTLDHHQSYQIILDGVDSILIGYAVHMHAKQRVIYFQLLQWTDLVSLDRQRRQVHHWHVRVSYKPIIDATRIWNKSDNALETCGVSLYPVNPLDMLA